MLSISIISHGQGSLIRLLLNDLQALNIVEHGRDEIVITLNIPEDESYLDLFNLPIRVMRNSSPKGFGANHNAAFETSRANLFVVMNPDVRLNKFDMNPMKEILAKDDVGLWAPLVRDSTGILEDSARHFPTVQTLARRAFLGLRTVEYSVKTEPISVDWAAGMFMAFRRDVYVAVGGFDERYYMYLEDADICRRLCAKGLKVILDPRVSVIHDGQRASRRNWRHKRWHYRSAARFLFGI